MDNYQTENQTRNKAFLQHLRLLYL